MRTNKIQNILLVCTTTLITLIHATSHANHFGSAGENGRDGRDGRSGSHGRDLTLEARGQRESVNLSGTDGENGENGSNALPPFCANGNYYSRRSYKRKHRHTRKSWRRRSHRPHHDIHPRDGTNGGHAGSGGNGGNAGNLTVHYKHISQLRRIQVYAIPGRGGYAGKPGYGTPACRCERRHWRIKVCKKIKKPSKKPTDKNHNRKHKEKNKLVTVCHVKRFRCYPGTDGIRGDRGNRGIDGRFGKIRIIKGFKPLLPDRAILSRPITEFTKSITTLSKNLWRTGRTRSIFAPGSRANPKYMKFQRRVSRQYQLVWNATRPITDFPGSVNLVLRQNHDKAILTRQFSSNLWLVTKTLDHKFKRTETVMDGMLQSDATNIIKSISGSGAETKIELKDKSHYANRLNTSFQLSVKRSAFLSWKTVFNGQVPTNAIERSNGKFIIKLGNLPFNKKYLGNNRSIKVNLSIKRSFHQYSTTITFKKKHRMKSDDEYESE